MQITIEIPDNSPELEQLTYQVNAYNTEREKNAIAAGKPVPTPRTLENWVTSIIMNELSRRVKKAYISHAQKRSVTELKTAFGDLDNVRNKP